VTLHQLLRCTGDAQCPVNENEVSLSNENEKRAPAAAAGSRHQAPCNNKEVKITRGQETRTSFLLLREQLPAPRVAAAGPVAIDQWTRTRNEVSVNEDQ